MLASIADARGEPDQPARQWLRDLAVPLGYKEAIEPGGVCPPADDASFESDVFNAFRDYHHKSYIDTTFRLSNSYDRN